jgi:hypothetical protein
VPWHKGVEVTKREQKAKEELEALAEELQDKLSHVLGFTPFVEPKMSGTLVFTFGVLLKSKELPMIIEALSKLHG